MVINRYNIVPGDDLRGANLAGFDLTGADLTDANLAGNDLTETVLRGTFLLKANLRGAFMPGVDLTDAILEEADLRDANLRGTNLRGANLRGADLRGADLRGAFMPGAILEESNLRDAILRDAILRDANLRGANLTGADLTRATLPEAPSLKSCLALNSNIEGAITNVNQLLNLIESNKNNEEESNIYKGHLKWIEDNMEELIRNNHITDKDKATIDDHNDRRDLSRLARCSRGVQEIITAGNNELTGVVELAFAQGILQSNNNNNGQEK